MALLLVSSFLAVTAKPTPRGGVLSPALVYEKIPMRRTRNAKQTKSHAGYAERGPKRSLLSAYVFFSLSATGRSSFGRSRFRTASKGMKPCKLWKRGTTAVRSTATHSTT